jgi:hypothetical protein
MNLTSLFNHDVVAALKSGFPPILPAFATDRLHESFAVLFVFVLRHLPSPVSHFL